MPSLIEIVLIVVSVYLLLAVAFVDANGTANKIVFKFFPLVLSVLCGLIAALSILNVI